jgi:hypothetical protein
LREQLMVAPSSARVAPEVLKTAAYVSGRERACLI